MFNKKEEALIDYLRNPLMYVARKIHLEKMEIDEFSNDELLTVYGKMDKYIEEEGEKRRSLGLLDEMYIIELLNVKNQLIKEMEKRNIA